MAFSSSLPKIQPVSLQNLRQKWRLNCMRMWRFSTVRDDRCGAIDGAGSDGGGIAAYSACDLVALAAIGMAIVLLLFLLSPAHAVVAVLWLWPFLLFAAQAAQAAMVVSSLVFVLLLPAAIARLLPAPT